MSIIIITMSHKSTLNVQVSLWPWSYGSWIYNYLCNQCLSPLKLWVRIHLIARCTFCQWFAAGRWFSPSTLVSFTNKTDHHDIAEILLNVALNTITLTLNVHCPNSWLISGFVTKVTRRCHMWSRNCTPFRSTWVYLGF